MGTNLVSENLITVSVEYDSNISINIMDIWINMLTTKAIFTSDCFSYGVP